VFVVRYHADPSDEEIARFARRWSDRLGVREEDIRLWVDSIRGDPQPRPLPPLDLMIVSRNAEQEWDASPHPGPGLHEGKWDWITNTVNKRLALDGKKAKDSDTVRREFYRYRDRLKPVVVRPRTRQWHSSKRWTPDGDADIRMSYGRKPAAQIAASTGRTVTAVHQRAKYLGLRQRHLWEMHRLAALLNLLPLEPPGLTIKDLLKQWPTAIVPPPGIVTFQHDLDAASNRGIVHWTWSGVRGDARRYYRLSAMAVVERS